MQGNAAMHPGQGPGLSLHDLGEMSGVESVTLITSEMPVHAHSVGRSLNADGNSISPVNSVWAQSAAGRGLAALYKDGAPTGKVNSLQSLNVTGGSLPHNNMQPYLTLNFCIALQGVFPARP
jgi:microcystin-dependent protein